MARKTNLQESSTTPLRLPARNIAEEGELEKEIQDIVEELEMIISINNTQLKVMRKFIRHARTILSRKEEGTGKKYPWYSRRQASSDHNSFKFEADELLVRVGDRIDDLQRLLRSANNAAGAVCAVSQQQHLCVLM